MAWASAGRPTVLVIGLLVYKMSILTFATMQPGDCNFTQLSSKCRLASCLSFSSSKKSSSKLKRFFNLSQTCIEQNLFIVIMSSYRQIVSSGSCENVVYTFQAVSG